MGLWDKLFGKASNDKAADEKHLFDYEALKNAIEESRTKELDDRMRAEKSLRTFFRELLLTKFSGYSIRENVEVTELVGDLCCSFKLYKNRPYQVYKAEWGRPYSFVLYEDSRPVGVIMLMGYRGDADLMEVLVSKMYAKKLDIPYMAFYADFQNEEDYVVNRIKKNIRNM